MRSPWARASTIESKMALMMTSESLLERCGNRLLTSSIKSLFVITLPSRRNKNLSAGTAAAAWLSAAATTTTRSEVLVYRCRTTEYQLGKKIICPTSVPAPIVSSKRPDSLPIQPASPPDPLHTPNYPIHLPSRDLSPELRNTPAHRQAS